MIPRGVQIGTAYLFCPEASVPPLYRRALKNLQDDQTALTNIFTGHAARAAINRIARELGPMDKCGSTFPVVSAALAPLRAKSEAAGLYDFTPI